MSNVVDFSAVKARQVMETEETKTQLEEGYFRLANELSEALARLDASGTEHRILHVVMRKTFGYNKKSDWISNDQMSELTGIDAKNISRTVKKLIERKILIRESKKFLKINTSVSEWIDQRIVKKADSELTEKTVRTDGKNRQNGRNETVNSEGHKRQTTKNNNYKNTLVLNDDPPDEKNSPVETKSKRAKKPDSFKKFFARYPSHRKGGTDASAWKAWNSEKLTEQDADDALAWLTTTQASNPDWETLAKHQFVVGIVKFISERRWLTPMPLQCQQSQSGSNWVPDDNENFYQDCEDNMFIHSTCPEDF